MARSPTPSILVVDHDRLTLSMLAMLLTDAGYLVETVRDVRSAMKAIEPRRPDLILVDLDMMLTDDYSLLDALRSRWKGSLKVIGLTARPETDLAELGEVEIDGWIRKPFDVEDFLDRIDRHLRLSNAA